ncbi:MAG: uL15 family ribosomal protein [Candidatus Freyarchaeota archaeon]|nr:uL15 family ribosomal protein [Candidatus Jordarchaeia archaeon]MBS7268656.1 uL15 family ribosomal protein [Candidatus Jordarchaeia archaeon]MBS7279510.1 uL15 family ribosomal protein [Candidatus Jordarchaeia archaeon]
MIRRRKKTRKMRGSRTHGFGQVGQHRSKGQRGGRGQTGKHKHLWIQTIKYEPDYFGKYGFTRYERIVKNPETINVGTIDQFAEKFSSGKQENMLVIDLHNLGYDKVLGSGKVTRPLLVKAESFTEKAKEKIEAAGGKVVTPNQ